MLNLENTKSIIQHLNQQHSTFTCWKKFYVTKNRVYGEFVSSATIFTLKLCAIQIKVQTGKTWHYLHRDYARYEYVLATYNRAPVRPRYGVVPRQSPRLGDLPTTPNIHKLNEKRKTAESAIYMALHVSIISLWQWRGISTQFMPLHAQPKTNFKYILPSLKQSGWFATNLHSRYVPFVMCNNTSQTLFSVRSEGNSERQT